MTPNNPMTEGEALAVLRTLAEEIRANADDNPKETMSRYAYGWAKELEALTAHTAASGGEAVAFVGTDGKLAWMHDGDGIGVPTILPVGSLLYAIRPPAAVPADALERLAEKWRRDSVNERDYYADALRACADELAALIPKGADHA